MSFLGNFFQFSGRLISWEKESVWPKMIFYIIFSSFSLLFTCPLQSMSFLFYRLCVLFISSQTFLSLVLLASYLFLNPSLTSCFFLSLSLSLSLSNLALVLLSMLYLALYTSLTLFYDLNISLSSMTRLQIFLFFCLLLSSRSFHLNNVTISVTRLGDLLDFGHLFKAFGNN